MGKLLYKVILLVDNLQGVLRKIFLAIFEFKKICEL